MLVQACLNGARDKSENRAIPITPLELAKDAAEIRDAGASEIHFHPRDANGTETLEPIHVAESLEHIREAVPGMPIGITTGTWISPGGRARLELIQNWTVVPDFASVNINEADSVENMERLSDLGVSIEAGIWCREDALIFVGLKRPDCLRILLEIQSEDPVAAEQEYRKCISVFKDARCALPILLHGNGGSVWPMVELALREGHDTRVGYEDGLFLRTGAKATSNAEFVREAIQMKG